MIQLPPKKLLLLILLFSLVNPLQYAIMVLTTPEGKVFLSYVDDAFQLALMKAVAWNFESPWDFRISVFENPFLGASYTFVILGTLPALLSINMFFVFVVVKFLLSVFYLVLVYNVMLYFLDSEKQAKVGYTLFLFSAGIGSFIYGLFFLFYPQYSPIVGYALTTEFDELGSGVHALSHLTRIYWLLPEITGLISLMLFIRKKYIFSGIFLGLTVLFYPPFAFAFAFLIVIYFIMTNYKKSSFKNAIRNLLPVIVIPALFAAPWLLSYLASPYYFNQYRAWFSGLPPITLVISFFFTLSLGVYGFYRFSNSLLNKKIYVVLLVLFGFLSSILHLYEFSGGSTLLKGWLSATNLLGLSQFLHSNVALIDLPLAFLFVLLFVDILRKNVEDKYKFVLLWAVAMIPMTIISAQFVFWWPARMRWFLLIPLSILSVKGVEYLGRRRILSIRINLTQKTILLLVVLLSLPSLFAFNAYMQQVAHSNELVYISQEDYKALQFLKTQPNGRVLSLHQIGNNIPFFTDKRALLFNAALDQRMQDVIRFYSDSSTEEKFSILQKYQIDYVFLGENEIKLGTLEGLPYLEKIYDGKTRVYKVVAA